MPRRILIIRMIPVDTFLYIAQGAFEQGLIYSFMVMGLYISYKILNVADLTVDSSFTLGAAVTAVFTAAGQPWLGLLAGIAAGAAAGIITGLLQTKLRIQPILSGILTMTGLYSVNLLIMGKSSLSTAGKENVFALFSFLGKGFSKIPLLIILAAGVIALLTVFFRTQIGMSVRATGDNEQMVRASSINADAMKILGLAAANALVALSGGLLQQYNNAASADMGVGTVVIGLASIVIGEALFRRGGVLRGLISALLGSIIYRCIFAAVLQIGLDASYMKLFTALFIVAAVAVPTIKRSKKNG